MADEQNNGGSNGGDGGGIPPEGPKFITAEEFNRAFSAREARLRKDYEEKMASFIAKQAEAVPATEVDDTVEEMPTASAKPSKDALRLKRVEDQLKKTQQQMSEKEQQLEKERVEMKLREERTVVQSALASLGVEASEEAMTVLSAKKMIGRDASGNVVMLIARKDKDSGQEWDDDMPLEKGLKDWLENGKGRVFAPPRGVEGSGSSPVQGVRRQRQMTREEQKADAYKTLESFVLGTKR